MGSRAHPAPSSPSSPSVSRPDLSLSELVALTGVPASTIHHYLRRGVIPPANRCSPSRFTYDERHVTALRHIRARRERGVRPGAITGELPELLAGDAGEGGSPGRGDARERIIDAAVEAFRTHSYAEVTVGEIAEVARMGKGSVYLHFSSKEEIFTATIERLLARAAADFAETIEHLGGPEGVAGAPEKTAGEFARLVAATMPVLLELGARAAKGHEPSQDLARRVLCTMAEAAGRPLTADAADPIPAGIVVLKEAFATVLRWATGPDWPAGLWPNDDLDEDDDEGQDDLGLPPAR